MGFYEKFSDELNEQADAWKQKDKDLKSQIDTQKGLVEKYQGLIDADMEKGDATDETAKNSLNLQYAQKRLDAAEKELSEHEATPLYSLDEYNAVCGEIINNYKVDVLKEREKLQNNISECLAILDNMNELGRMAARCDNAVKTACKDCGEDIKTEFSKPRYSGLAGRVTPFFVREYTQTFKQLELGLKR